MGETGEVEETGKVESGSEGLASRVGETRLVESGSESLASGVGARAWRVSC